MFLEKNKSTPIVLDIHAPRAGSVFLFYAPFPPRYRTWKFTPNVDRRAQTAIVAERKTSNTGKLHE